jgi:hypothetical protein
MTKVMRYPKISIVSIRLLNVTYTQKNDGKNGWSCNTTHTHARARTHTHARAHTRTHAHTDTKRVFSTRGQKIVSVRFCNAVLRCTMKRWLSRKLNNFKPIINNESTNLLPKITEHSANLFTIVR